MDQAAYLVALAALVAVPTLLVSWFLIHPLIGLWRRLPPAAAYVTVGAAMLAVAATMVRFREPLLEVRYGIRPPMVLLAIVLFVVSQWLAAERRHVFPATTLAGLPEIRADGGDRTLVTAGIYGRIRNPRYVEGFFLLAAGALFSNYLVVWVLLAAFVPLIGLTVWLEERELRQRFGTEYEKYCRRVPRFVPSWKRRDQTRLVVP